MSINRVFLDWSVSCLPQVAIYLISNAKKDSYVIDLRDYLLILPSSRAQRRLTELLALEAKNRDRILLSPQSRTIGELPEELYTPKYPFANSFQRKTTWMEVILEYLQNNKSHLIPNYKHGSELRLSAFLADKLDSIWTEISSVGLQFKDVPQKAASLINELNEKRFCEMQNIYESFIASLSRQSLSDKYTERLRAIDNNDCSTSKSLILIATADLRPITSKMLDVLNSNIVSLVYATGSKQNMFDKYGCLLIKEWSSTSPSIDRSQIIITQNPSTQAEEAFSCLHTLSTCTTEDIVFATTNDELSPYLFEESFKTNIPIHYTKGSVYSKTTVSLLLRSLSEYLKTKSYDAFSSFIRHPDIEEFLLEDYDDTSPKTLNVPNLDQYYYNHLPQTFVLADHDLNSSAISSLLEVFDLETRSLADWSARVAMFLQRIYADPELFAVNSLEEMSLKALEKTFAVLEECNMIEKSAVKCFAHEFLDIVLQHLSSQIIDPSSVSSNYIEVMGWLELPLDDSKSAIVLGMNEGYVPQSINADAFLPNSLRSVLGLIDNERRYARDVYVLSSMLASKKPLYLLASRVSETQDPLMLSRLLLKGKKETTINLIKDFYQFSEEHLVDDNQHQTSNVLPVSPLPYPPKPLKQKITEMSITSFRDYKKCPYRFYLKHILKLNVINDKDKELSSLAFGTLGHKVLHEYGRNPLFAALLKPSEIYAALEQILLEKSQKSFGQNPRPSVLVQLEQLKFRLKKFAYWQSDWRKKGWLIKHSELELDEEVSKLELEDGSYMKLNGRIDRIDLHPASNTWMIFDYKFSDTKNKKSRTSKDKTEWNDFQLPLYYYAIGKLNWDGELFVSYLDLTAEAGKDYHEDIFEGNKSQITNAIDEAKNIAYKVKSEVFYPPNDKYKEHDEYANICGISYFTEEEDEEENESE